MERELTPDIKTWLESEDTSVKHTLEGAELLLRINKNRILYDNTRRMPQKYAEHVRYQLQKLLDQRTKEDAIAATRRQMREMSAKVDALMSAPSAEIRKGKRADHDSLPQEIQDLYVENDSIRLRMRECHLRMRMINSDNSSCLDSDRYPWAKEIIRLDKQYRENWYKYDHFDPVKNKVMAPADPKAASRDAVRLISLNKKRYKDNPTPEMKKRLKNWYDAVLNPSERLKAEMIKLGIINEED